MTDYVYSHQCREMLYDPSGRPRRIITHDLPHARDIQMLFRDYFHRSEKEMLALLQKHVSKKIVSCELFPDYTAPTHVTSIIITTQTPPHTHLSQRKKKQLWAFFDAQFAGDWGRKFSHFVWTDPKGNKFGIR